MGSCTGSDSKSLTCNQLSVPISSPRPRHPIATELRGDTGVRLGQFIIDILVATDHVDIHLVTRGSIVEGLDKVTAMLCERYIQFEVWVDLHKFLTHLGPTEGYLSADQFLVYGTSSDVLHIIRERRNFMDVINIGITTWYYVVLDNEATTQELADALEESSIAILLRPSTHSEGTWVAFTLISPGDGTTHFTTVGRWTERDGLVVRGVVFPPRSHSFHGRTLTIGVINKRRVLQENKDTGMVEGYSIDILRVLQDSLNFTVSLRWFDTWGEETGNGSWDGVIGALIRKEIHFSPMDFTPTKESRAVIDFSDWVSEDPVIITSAAPQPHVRPFLLLEIYSLELPSIRASLYNASKTIVSQCLKKLPEPFSVRVFLFHVWIVSLVIDMAYQGHITAFIAIPRFTPAIDHHEHLSQNRSVTPVTELSSTTQTMITESDRVSFQAMSERLEAFDGAFLESKTFFDGVASGRWAYVDTLSSAFGRSLDHEIEGQRCRFYRSRQSVAGGLDAWPFPRNSPVHGRISQSLKSLRFYGLLEHIKSRFYVSRCLAAHGLRTREQGKMNLVMTQSCFYVLLFGFGLSALSLVLEVLLALCSSCDLVRL
ncbi:ionotropic receptor 93a-like [Portunus trituberculatus]|uniref:ionotropic receptor 93a-like n=1 Tax=Portunus trituberculatus TaxID=210409 RepID=UPI001E1CC4F6|nr:ionotropic receptor 93a-like [Portunus trituberculatus]